MAKIAEKQTRRKRFESKVLDLESLTMNISSVKFLRRAKGTEGGVIHFYEGASYVVESNSDYLKIKKAFTDYHNSK